MKTISRALTTSPLRFAALLASALLSASPVADASEGVQLARLSTANPVHSTPSAKRPHSERTVLLYGEIFDLQKKGAWKAADALLARLEDDTLLGHVQFQRYMHPTAYRSSYRELADWLEAYGDHPDAKRVYKLALKRRPRGAAAPLEPKKGYMTGSGQQSQELVRVRYRSSLRRSAAEETVVQAWLRDIGRLGDRGRVAEAERLFDQPDIHAITDAVETDLARWALACAHFVNRDFAPALKHALGAAKRSGHVVPEMHWTVGMSAWRTGDIDTAATHLAKLAEAENAHDGERARSAYWAARAVGFKTERARYFLEIAADHPRQFYGLLARQRLGMAVDHQRATKVQDDVAEIMLRYPAAKRASMLAEIGRHDLAEKELRTLAASAKSNLTAGLLKLAQTLHLPAVEMRLAHRLGYKGDVHLDAFYPVPAWQPHAGYRVDRAMVFSVIRAESGFDPAAESYVGARGLMQVMPGTARHIAKRTNLVLKDNDHLFDPETAITFGQAYLQELLNRDGIGDNLMFIAAGYNAGPGRIAQWRDAFNLDHDPAMFLEMIPFVETRVYVKKVLANFWNYRARLGQPTPSLDAMAANAWPSYRAFDDEPNLYAGAGQPQG
ncbi:MAG: lytic transglycosylase domain-containing protein [Alphaproteobacteria bacterium]|nr:lytic transglycosylase domain-containing protein [Alphaproteobacteria bacterium]